jgi:hypothetical protein
MVFDDMDLPWDDLTHAKAAAKRFLTAGLAANDQVAVLTVSSGVLLPFTADAARIADFRHYLKPRNTREFPASVRAAR